MWWGEFKLVYSHYIIARVICGCRICGSTKWWRIGVSTNLGYSFYIASMVYYLARKRGKHIPQRLVAERYKVTGQTIRNHRRVVAKPFED